jgi:16S rRNA (uracil1498-N3)-methyltransferase
VSLPLFHLPAGALDAAAPDSTVVLGGPEGHHAATVRRLRQGERLVVADGAGRSVVGEVASVGAGELTVRVESVRDEPVPSPRIVLVQALAKGGRDEDAVEAATELGVDVVIPWQASRSVVRWRGPKAEKGHRKWVHTVESAAKQSRRTRTPLVPDLVTTRGLARVLSGASAAYVLHEAATDPLATAPLPDDGDVVLVVGPEGGIADDELADLRAAGGVPVRLGESVLRSSTAGPAAIAVVSARLRWR